MPLSRPNLLKAQVYFAYASGGTALVLALLAISFPAISLALLGYGIFSSLLCQHWRRSIASGSMALAEHIVSIAIWALPLLACLVGLAAMIAQEYDSRPDLFADETVHPIAFISFSIAGLFWFSVPLLCSILVARTDALQSNTQPTPALR